MEDPIDDSGRHSSQVKPELVNLKSQHVQEKSCNGINSNGLCMEPLTGSTNFKGQNWAHFGPTGTTELDDSEDWAAFDANPVGENGFGSHESWTSFSGVGSSAHVSGSGWTADRTEHDQEHGSSSSSKGVSTDSEDWQDFTYSGDLFETGHNVCTSLLTASVNFGSTLDSCTHVHSSISGRKARSSSFPAEPHGQGPHRICGALCGSSRRTLKDCFHASADLATDSADGLSGSLPKLQSLVERRYSDWKREKVH